MERLHRVIEEERWEIEHHRPQEREELAEMYRKGSEGKLLEEVLDVLMADDNRLLQVMLEEELGLTLEAYEHPVTNRPSAPSCGALVLPLSFACLGFWAFPSFGLPLLLPPSSIILSAPLAKLEKNRILHSFVWNLAIAATGCRQRLFLNPSLMID